MAAGGSITAIANGDRSAHTAGSVLTNAAVHCLMSLASVKGGPMQ